MFIINFCSNGNLHKNVDGPLQRMQRIDIPAEFGATQGQNEIEEQQLHMIYIENEFNNGPRHNQNNDEPSHNEEDGDQRQDDVDAVRRQGLDNEQNRDDGRDYIFAAQEENDSDEENDNINNNGNNDDGGGGDIEENDDDRPLYSGAQITVRQSMLLILAILLHNSLNMSCVENIIFILELHCLSENLVKNSLYKLKQYFGLCGVENVIKHFFCSACYRQLATADDNCITCLRAKKIIFCGVAFYKSVT